jgi:hypothetical protein
LIIMDDLVDIATGGPGEDKNTIAPPPKNYTALSVQQRGDWNGFLDYVGKQPGANLNDPKMTANLLAQYKKQNPTSSLTSDIIPSVQYEQQQLRTGDKFGNLGPEQLKYLRQGLSPAYLNRPVTDVSKLYYPQGKKGGVDYGTDIEGYTNALMGKPATPPATASSTTTGPQKPIPGAIPAPDYSDSSSRLNFAQQWAKKYGIEDGYGDIPLRVNEKPYTGTDTSRNMAMAAAKTTGIDPALLYSSSMVEGASGLYPDKNGKVRYGPDPDYKVQGAAFGLNNFASRVPEMVKKGYLPQNFDYKKRDDGSPNSADSADFKNFQDAMQAHAARLKLDYDEINNYAQKKGIELSPKAKDFFALANFNSGLGKQMLDDYNKNGYLKGDAYLKERPTKGEGLKETSYKGVYDHIMVRMKERDALKKEGQFPQ